MTQGLLGLSLLHPACAAGVGLVLGLAATQSAVWVAVWSHRLGLRPDAPSGGWLRLMPVLGLAAVSAVCAALPVSLPAGRFLLGCLWGHAGMEFATNTRAAIALRAMAADPEALAAWLALPLPARYAVVTAAGVAAILVLAVLFLLTCEPGILGFLAGAGWSVWRQRLAVAAALVSAVQREDAPAPVDEP